MKKIMIVALCSCFIFGCDDITISGRDLKTEIFYKCHDSLNDNIVKGYEQISKGNKDSALYYMGKVDAFWEMEDYISKKQFK